MPSMEASPSPDRSEAIRKAETIVNYILTSYPVHKAPERLHDIVADAVQGQGETLRPAIAKALLEDFRLKDRLVVWSQDQPSTGIIEKTKAWLQELSQ